MSFYFSFDLPDGGKGIARVFNQGNGYERCEVLCHTHGCKVSEWATKPPRDATATKFTTEEATTYVDLKNQRWVRDALRFVDPKFFPE